MGKVIGKCPVCGGRVYISELRCEDCGTKVSGRFELDRLSQLPEDLYKFLLVFLEARGNIKEVERKLKVSYPTVKNRLSQLLKALDMEVPPISPSEVIDMLERGEITAEEAVRLIKEGRR